MRIVRAVGYTGRVSNACAWASPANSTTCAMYEYNSLQGIHAEITYIVPKLEIAPELGQREKEASKLEQPWLTLSTMRL